MNLKPTLDLLAGAGARQTLADEMRRTSAALDAVKAPYTLADELRRTFGALNAVRTAHGSLQEIEEFRAALDPSRAVIAEVERMRHLAVFQQRTLVEVAGLHHVIDDVRRYVFTHSALQLQIQEFRDTFAAVNRAVPLELRSWNQLLAEHGAGEALRAAWAAAAVANTYEDEPEHDPRLIEDVLSLIERFIAAMPLAKQRRWMRKNYQFLAGLLITFAILIYQEQGAAETDRRRADEHREVMASLEAQDKRLQRVEEVLGQLVASGAYSKFDGREYVVTGSNVRVRAEPEGSVLTLAGANQLVTSLAKCGRWLKISYYDHVDDVPVEGWVRKDYLKPLAVTHGENGAIHTVHGPAAPAGESRGSLCSP